MTGGIPVARLFGIEIRVSISWAILAAVVTIVGAEQAAVTGPALAAPVQWIVGGVVALGFLASVVAHELAHALVGRGRGVPASAIVLGFVGGLAPLSIQASRARDELAIALAGPVLSLIVAGIIVPLAVLAGAADPVFGPVAGGLLLVGGLNLLLGVVSLLPGLPLDGGRVVRALAWSRSGDRDQAGRVTARVGRILGWTTVGIGLALALADQVTPGLFVACFGWLLATGARTLDRRLELEGLLRGVTVGGAMVTDGPRVGPNLTIDTFANRFQGEDAVTAMPVVEDERVLGVIGVRRLQRLNGRKYATTRAADIMATAPGAPLLAPGSALWDAVDTLHTSLLDGLAVVEDGRFLGMVTREAVAAVIRDRVAAGETGGTAGRSAP
jgi:Zn-dependent protease/CBS domain-containing protein